MPKRKNAEAETKVKLVKGYLTGKFSQTKGAKVAGVSLASFQQWIMKYEAEGVAAFYEKGKCKQYSEETKRQAVEDYLSGKGA